MKPVVELRGVRFGYGSEYVLDDINLHLHSGQFAAVVGPSGAGKTSLLKLILRILEPSVGQISYRKSPPLRAAYVPQLETVDWNFPVTVKEVVLMGRIRHTRYSPWSRPADRRLAHEILTQLEINDLADRHIRDLSGGQQQRVFLARALIAEPDILILDEPTTGVDMRSAENILHHLAALNRQGMTILLSTHDLNMAAAHVPWVICLNGNVVAQGPPDKVFTDEILSSTYRGEMQVIRQDGRIFVHQKPHTHGIQDVIPAPVPGGLPDQDGNDADSLPV